jgi:hypothetical protein
MPSVRPRRTVASILALDDAARVSLVSGRSRSALWAHIEDGQGQRALVCIDLRPDSPTLHRLFDRARHPNRRGAVLVELGSDVEKIVIRLIARWFDSSVPSKLRYSKADVANIREAFLGQRV